MDAPVTRESARAVLREFRWTPQLRMIALRAYYSASRTEPGEAVERAVTATLGAFAESLPEAGLEVREGLDGVAPEDRQALRDSGFLDLPEGV